MPYPQNYTPTTGFANEETNQAAGRSTVKTVKLDTEFANISSSINAINSNLKLIQRDDGNLKDLIVEPYALSEQTRALISAGGKPKGNWQNATLYSIGDSVQYESVAYMCHITHTSTGVFDYSVWMAISSNGVATSAAQQAAISAQQAADSSTTAQIAASNLTTALNDVNEAKTIAVSSSTQAVNSANSSANSATSAANSAASAANSATSAANSAASATNSATNSATSANTATTKASEASSSAATATTKASEASSSANTATTKASEASSSASAASTSSTKATNAQLAAEAARDQTLASFDSFDDRYLGSKTSDPSVDNDGNTLTAGALYFNSSDSTMKIYTGSIWVAAYVSGTGFLTAASNLSDLNNIISARDNLGLEIGVDIPSKTGGGASGNWEINSIGIKNATGWSVTPSGTKLYFNYNGANVGKLDSSGNLTVLGDVIALNGSGTIT